VNIKLDLVGVFASWRLEFEGIFAPQEWNDIVERINQSIKWNPIKYLAALFMCLIAICFIGFGVTLVFTEDSLHLSLYSSLGLVFRRLDWLVHACTWG